MEERQGSPQSPQRGESGERNHEDLPTNSSKKVQITKRPESISAKSGKESKQRCLLRLSKRNSGRVKGHAFSYESSDSLRKRKRKGKEGITFSVRTVMKSGERKKKRKREILSLKCRN